MRIQCRLIDLGELHEREDAGARYGDTTMFVEPGMMWFLPQIYDHQDPDLEQYRADLLRHVQHSSGKSSLSVSYLTQWSRYRDPIAMMLPGSTILYPDCRYEDGTEFEIVGPFPTISLNRYVVVERKHSYLIRDGVIALQD